MTDHRIGLTLYNLDRVMQGDLDPADHGPDRPRPPRATRRGVTHDAQRHATRRGLVPRQDAQRPAPAAAARPDADDRWTVGRLLTWTTDFLKRQGAESPRLDAEVLLAKVLDWERVQLYTHYEDEVGEQAAGEPSATWSAAAPRGCRWPTWSAARNSTRSR